MKINKQRLIIASCMVCIVLSIAAVSFSLAWYAMYPVYKDLELSIGDSALTLNSRIFTRTIDATNQPGWGQTMGKDYNVKTHDDRIKPSSSGSNSSSSSTSEQSPDAINGSLSDSSHIAYDNSGTLIVTFPELSYNLFAPKDDSANPGGIIDQNGGLLDKDTMSIDIRYLTFALFELNFTNGFFNNYVYGDIRLEMSVVKTGDVIDLTPYQNMIEIRSIEDTNNENDSKVNFLKSASDILVDPATVAPLEKYTTEHTPIKAAISDGQTITSPGATHLMFTGHSNPSTELESPNQYLVLPNPNRNYLNPQLNFYSYAKAFSLSFNPILFMDFFTKYNHLDTKLKLKVTMNFHASGNEISKTEAEGYAK